MVTNLGSLVQLSWWEGGTLQTNIADVSGEHSQCMTTLGLPPLTALVLSRSTLLRLQLALQGKCPKQALGFKHFAGLSHSRLGLWVLHKGADSVGRAFCALPRSEQLRRPATW